METKVSIEIQGQVVEAAAGALTGEQIRKLGGAQQGSVYWLEGERRRHVPDPEIFEICGGERFIVVDEHEGHHHEHLPLPIEVDGTRFEAPRREMTGAEIKSLARRPAANRLYRIEQREGHPFRQEIADTEKVCIHRDECFVTQPPVGKAS